MASLPGWVLSDLFRLGCGRYLGLHPEQSFLLFFRHAAKVEASSSWCFPAGFGSGAWYRCSSQSPTGLVKPPQSCQAGPRQLPESPSSSWEQNLFFPAAPSAGHGVTGPPWESGSCPACVALLWPSVQLGTSQQDWAADPAQRSPGCPQAGWQHLAGDTAAALLGCSVCMEVLEVGAGQERCSSCWTQSLSLASSALRCVHGQPLHPSSPQHFHDLENLGTFLL